MEPWLSGLLTDKSNFVNPDAQIVTAQTVKIVSLWIHRPVNVSPVPQDALSAQAMIRLYVLPAFEELSLTPQANAKDAIGLVLLV